MLRLKNGQRGFTFIEMLVALAILFGVYPRAVLDYITPSVQKTVVEMKAVTENIDQAAAMKAVKDALAQPQEREQP